MSQKHKHYGKKSNFEKKDLAFLAFSEKKLPVKLGFHGNIKANKHQPTTLKYF